MAIAPNLTVLVGELVGARLIAHAGTLMNLAKHPASTVQILGAEKALFKVESRIRQLEGGEITKISATAKQSAKFDKYESKSEVLEYKAAADVTLKRKAEDDDEEKPDVKKIKVEDVEAEGSKKKKEGQAEGGGSRSRSCSCCQP